MSPNAWLTFSKYWRHGPKVNTKCWVNPTVTGYHLLLCGEETFSNSSGAGVVFSHLYSSGLMLMDSEQAELQVAMKEWRHLFILRPKRDSLSSMEKELECTQLLWLPGSQRVGLCEGICSRTPCQALVWKWGMLALTCNTSHWRPSSTTQWVPSQHRLHETLS